MPTQTKLMLLLQLRGLWAEEYEAQDFNRPKTQRLFEAILNSDHIEDFDDVIYTASRIEADKRSIDSLLTKALVTSGIALTCLEEPLTNQELLTHKARWSTSLKQHLRLKSLQHAIYDLNQ